MNEPTFINGDPPPRGTIDWEPIAAKLEANTRQWAIIDIGRKESLRTIASNINCHSHSAARRVRYGFEAAVRNGNLYIRHVGDDPAEKPKAYSPPADTPKPPQLHSRLPRVSPVELDAMAGYIPRLRIGWTEA